jgi:hypothetical protein
LKQPGREQDYRRNEDERKDSASVHENLDLGNRIISAGMERMAPSNAANRQHQPSPRSVFLERFDGILGARG